MWQYVKHLVKFQILIRLYVTSLTCHSQYSEVLLSYSMICSFCILCLHSALLTFRFIFFKYIHPSIFYTVYPLVGSQGGWSLSQCSSGKRRGTPWTGRQFFKYILLQFLISLRSVVNLLHSDLPNIFQTSF